MLRVLDNEDSNNKMSDDKSVMPSLVAQVEDSDNNSRSSHMENNLDNSDVPYGDIVQNYNYKLDDNSVMPALVA